MPVNAIICLHGESLRGNLMCIGRLLETNSEGFHLFVEQSENT